MSVAFDVGRIRNKCSRCATPEPPVVKSDGRHEHYRAMRNAVCTSCGRDYEHHPFAREYKTLDGDAFLNRLCNGELVKVTR